MKKSYLPIGYLKYEGKKPISQLTYENGQIIENIPAVQYVEQSKTYTKLQIRRAMRKINMEDFLDGIISGGYTDFGKDWYDAQDISLTDPAFVEALQKFDINQEMIDQIIENIQE